MTKMTIMKRIEDDSIPVDRGEPNLHGQKEEFKKLITATVKAAVKEAQEHASVRIMKRDNREDNEMNLGNVDLQGMAHIACEILAKELRKNDPKLTIEQAYAKVYESNIDIRKADRYGATLNFAKAYSAVAHTEPAIEYGNSNNTGLAALEKLAAELRQRNPFLTVEQAFAQVYSDPANRELVTAERAAAYERMLAPGVRIMA